ncbi:hypothetical protein B0X56_07535 [Helicobacter pylori]|uniref:Type I restriction endonuclease subunit M n=1 Tax=Helicobacter pylori TaxID=210 RepID=A0ABD6QVB0_HELPX|nr:hypothetical protein B0X56_07535 [Helicobacter pylori]PDX03054.1 hypothetical protein BB401_05460 [Helicobacter pylori]
MIVLIKIIIRIQNGLIIAYFTNPTKTRTKNLKNTKAKIFFKSPHKRAYLKKPSDFGHSNTQAGV